MDLKKLAAEAIGTFWLTFGGVAVLLLRPLSHT
jgi:glycerol uptake facilitator-like aquaporin